LLRLTAESYLLQCSLLGLYAEWRWAQYTNRPGLPEPNWNFKLRANVLRTILQLCPKISLLIH